MKLSWRVVRRIARGPSSPWLVAAGPVILIATVMSWVLLLWAGWSLVFIGMGGAVLDVATQVPADTAQRVYYAGYALFTLGNGGFAPVGVPAQLATNLATLTGLFVITMAITYLLPVLSAVTERRQQSAFIAAFGDSSSAILLAAWDGSGFSWLEQQLGDMARAIALTAERHLAYPALHYFHGSSRRSAFAPNLAALDEALTAIRLGVDQALPRNLVAIEVTQRTIREALKLLEEQFLTVQQHPPAPADLRPLAHAGVPVDIPGYEQQLGALCEHRRRMAGFVGHSGWSWEHVNH